MNHRCRSFHTQRLGEALLQTLTVGSLHEKQTKRSSISTECIREFTARGECFMQPKVTENFDVVLLSGQRKHLEENHRQLIQPPNTQLHRHSTCSASKGHGIHPSFHFQRSACSFPKHCTCTVYDSRLEVVAARSQFHHWPLEHQTPFLPLDICFHSQISGL